MRSSSALRSHDSKAPPVRPAREKSSKPSTMLVQRPTSLSMISRYSRTTGHGTVTVTTRTEGTFAVTELSDDGPGIPPDVLSKIFEPFYTTKGPTRGTGLGLAICYGIVADHHGRLDVRSEPGRGSTFRMALPIAREEAS